MTYAINVLTKPKKGDLYEEVAVNTIPMIVRCGSWERLQQILHSDTIVSHIYQLLKTEEILSNARLCVREIENPNNINYISCDFLMKKLN